MNNGPTLHTGSTGNDVRRLQRIFVMTKELDLSHLNGVFDATTKQCVIDFQTGAGLTVDGIVGPATWHALPADPNTPKLSHGSTGTAVTALQHFLKGNSPPGPNPGAVDGHYGTLTETALKFYQQSIGVTADGIVGDHTWWSPAGAAGATLASLCVLTTV